MRFLFICSLVLLTACGKFDVINHPAQDIENAKHICIVNNPETRAGFQQAMQSWLQEHNIPFSNLASNAPLDTCEWTLTYHGRWSWDLALFLSDAKITAFNEGQKAGEVGLIVGQWDAFKFEKGSVRIKKMMDMLYAKIDQYPLPKQRQGTQKMAIDSDSSEPASHQE